MVIHSTLVIAVCAVIFTAIMILWAAGIVPA
jgi:hypothetical protein